MRNFIRYFLALAVLTAGFYGASRYRLSQEQARSSQTAEATQTIPSDTTDPIPLAQTTPRQPPLAALIDTERTLTAEPPRDMSATLKTLPVIARREAEDTPEIADDSKPKKASPPRRYKRSGAAAWSPSSLAKGVNADEPQWTNGNLTTSPSTRRDTSWSASPAEKPDFQPQSTPSTAWFSEDPPLPKLDPRPGNRFSVSEYSESQTEAVVQEQTSYRYEARSFVDQFEPSHGRPETQTQPSSRADDQPVHRHRIEAGDTLPKLAARYLGDRDRYMEIYRANTETLGDPRLLPIGLEIAIPLRSVSPLEEHEEPRAVEDALVSDELFDELFGEATVKDESDSGMEPIPPQSLPPRDFGAWQYSAR